MNCPICGTPITVTPHHLKSVTHITMLTASCVRCGIAYDCGVDRFDGNQQEAIDYARKSLIYHMESQPDAQAKRLEAQLADLHRVQASLTKRLITTAGNMIEPFGENYRYADPSHFGCRVCGRVAATAEGILHTVHSSFKGKSYNCPLGAVQIAIDYLTSIQPAVTRGNDYDSGRRFIP